MHTMQPFQMRDQAVIGGGGHGIPADQQRVEAEGNAQLIAGEVITDAAIDGAIALQPDQIRRRTDQACKTMEGLIGQICEGHAKDAFAFKNETLKACTVLRRNPCDLGSRHIEVSRAAHHVAVIEPDQIKGVQRAQLNILRKLAPGERPEFFQQIGRCDDGGAGVKSETILVKDISAPTWRIELFQDCHTPTTRTKPNGRRQATKAGANHNRMRARVSGAFHQARFRQHIIQHETPY